MNPFDLVVFDFDGTLADSALGIAECMSAAFASFDLPPPPPSHVRVRIGLTLEESIRQLTGDHPGVDVAAIARRYRDLHTEVAAPAIAAFPGSRQALAGLADAGVKLAVVSQKARRGLAQLLTQLEIDPYFDLVLASDDVTTPKPNAALYDQHIASRHPDIPRERILVVGDTETDIQFALNIGASSCWAEYGYGDVRRCRALNPAYTIAHIADVTRVCGVE